MQMHIWRVASGAAALSWGGDIILAFGRGQWVCSGSMAASLLPADAAPHNSASAAPDAVAPSTAAGRAACAG